MNTFKHTPWLACTAALMLGACTTTQTVDLPGERQQNLEQDLELWKRSQQLPPEQGLTLQAAIEMGLENNLALRAAEFERAMFDDNERAAKLEMLPDLTVSAQRFRRNNQPRQDFIRDSDNQVTQSNVRSSFRTGTQSQLELSWSVLDFGLSYVRSRQAGYESLAQQVRTARQAQLLALDVTDAFWRSALAEDALDYLRSAEHKLKARKTNMQQARNEGLADPLSLTMASSRLVDVEIAIRDLQTAVSSARVDLARLLGMPLAQNFRLIREPIRPILSHLPRLPQLNTEALLRYALLNRPELYESDLNEKIRKDDVQAAMLSIFPDLSFGLGQYYDDNRLLRDNDWNRASASISWNLLAIPSKLASRSARKNAVEMTRFQRLQTTAGVIAQVHLSLLDYAAKTDRFLLRDEAAKLAEEASELRRANYAAGENNVMQVTESELNAVNTKMLRDQSVVELLVAYSRLQSSLGVPTELLPFKMTALCLPENQLSGSCLAKPGKYTPLVQINSTENSGLDDLSVVKLQTISKGEALPTQPDDAMLAQPSVEPEPAVAAPVQPTAPLFARDYINEQPIADKQPITDEQPAAGEQSLIGSEWVVFIGTYSQPKSQLARIEFAQNVNPTAFNSRNLVVQSLDKGLYRMGFIAASETEAQTACKQLKIEDMDCWVSSKPEDAETAISFNSLR